MYWYNLHVVLVHQGRWAEIRDDVLHRAREMVLKVSRAKKFLLSRAGILPDHNHLVVGCPIEMPPVDVALAFLNNLAFVQQMHPVFQFGGFIGTVGEYDQRSLASETSSDGSKSRRGVHV